MCSQVSNTSFERRQPGQSRSGSVAEAAPGFQGNGRAESDYFASVDVSRLPDSLALLMTDEAASTCLSK